VLAEWEPDAIVIACNTASVQALEAVRARYEPRIPVIGTVPAVKMAAGTGQDFAIWATPGDHRQRLPAEPHRLLRRRPARGEGRLPGIGRGDQRRRPGDDRPPPSRTPSPTMGPGMETVVLGCTHYGLVADRIMAARAGALTVFDSPLPVAKQTLRRIGLEPAGVGEEQPGTGRVLATFASGRRVRPAGVTGAPTRPARRLLAREAQAGRAERPRHPLSYLGRDSEPSDAPSHEVPPRARI
jgi:glutamate racemase